MLLGIAILVCGAVIGSGLTVVILHRIVIHAIHNPEEFPARITKRIKGKLNLSDAEAAKVQAIIARRQKAIQDIRREVWPRIESELESTREEVAAILNAKQARSWRKRFDYLKGQWMPPPPDRPREHSKE